MLYSLSKYYVLLIAIRLSRKCYHMNNLCFKVPLIVLTIFMCFYVQLNLDKKRYTVPDRNQPQNAEGHTICYFSKPTSRMLQSRCS